MSDTSFDYIVIGGGTAGALLCNRLSADRNVRVLLIEAGRKDDYHWIHIPVGYLHCIGNPRTDWLYQTEADAGLNGRSLRYPRGKTLGGCSSINGMIYMRGQARDYDQWATLTGDDSWRWEQVLPAFMKHENHWRLDEGQPPNPAFANLHGHKGEWRVEKQRLRWDILDAFSQAAQQAGIPATQDFNGGDNEGVGYFEVNQKDGWRWNTAKAFLRPKCYGRPNFEMWTMAQATRLVVERQADGALRCTGVKVWTGDELAHLTATEEVIVCAGAVNSPQLLQLSGIGPAEVLHQAGIPVTLDLPGVGANLQDHLQIRSVYKVRDALTLNTLAASPWGKLRIGMEYLLRRTGPMSMAPSQLGAFTRSRPELEHPNLQYHVQPLSLDAFGEPLHSFPAFTASVCNLNPTSRGTVHIKSPNFEDAPAIAPNYLSTAQDQQVAADSLRVTRRIVSQPALAQYAPEEWKPGTQYQSDEELIRLAGDIATTIFHPVGTTKMGRNDDPMAVLDSRLRVRGVQALRVVDAGAMPTITSGNTNSPTLMLAEKAAGWIRAERKAREGQAPLAAAAPEAPAQALTV
ncbi:GMC family oxidoreductase N-terminal domain-containing protein [Comamonas aquatica]|uniref:GMC family oxidoreductase N-terminal domain-containing protein n=1 Tax=Comamonas aquatica TaxID=225991 RepID=A0AA42W4F3_9BURK|nr:GMC family oxidoreductase N-terminal domain-containing protein [Comamonas aquatica]MDH0381361.1 GMC family oxidoreductase N-terminal domain-containing protein [Comamonas aquatica]MDH0429626.1 GMC family oxidoreductase N-terminal domain-containing protein [Comamonas aquatica]MDH0942199.1 GMC family oxidoreductase N-terminal domain-containing protein [Comamonas aquatica]MDH1426949.1 GMC family oxidoreductase N-terminal domain-containing protein [Comamonas aquatica]MDH1605761.1 GMC family oxid